MEKAVAQLAELGYDKKMGARPLGRVIEDKVKIPLSKKILFEKVPEGSLILIDYIDDQFTITVNKGELDHDEELQAEPTPQVDKSGLIVLDQFKPQT
jgi:hypothetical protein